MRRPSLPKPVLPLLAALLLSGCGRKGDPIPRPRIGAQAPEVRWVEHRILEVQLPKEDLEGRPLVGVEALRIIHLPLGHSRPSPSEVLTQGTALLEQRRPDLPRPGRSLRLDLRSVGREPGWIVVVAIRAGRVLGAPSQVLPWLHPAL